MYQKSENKFPSFLSWEILKEGGGETKNQFNVRTIHMSFDDVQPRSCRRRWSNTSRHSGERFSLCPAIVVSRPLLQVRLVERYEWTCVMKCTEILKRLWKCMAQMSLLTSFGKALLIRPTDDAWSTWRISISTTLWNSRKF